MKITIVSDLHILHPGFNRPACEIIVRDAERIISSGDMIDLYYTDIFNIYKKAGWLLELLNEKMGVYVPGNHDNDMKCLSTTKKCVLYPGAIIDVQGKKWYVTHGHLFGPQAIVFGIMDKLDSFPLFRAIVRAVTKNRILASIGHFFSRTVYRDATKEYAIKRAKELGVDVVVCGHNHKADLCKVDGIIYANAGCFANSYIIYEDGLFTLYKVGECEIKTARLGENDD